MTSSSPTSSGRTAARDLHQRVAQPNHQQVIEAYLSGLENEGVTGFHDSFAHVLDALTTKARQLAPH